MIQWQPMDTLTEKEEHGEIILKWKNSEPLWEHSIWHWSDCWKQAGNPTYLPTRWFREYCVGWQRLR